MASITLTSQPSYGAVVASSGPVHYDYPYQHYFLHIPTLEGFDPYRIDEHPFHKVLSTIMDHDKAILRIYLQDPFNKIKLLNLFVVEVTRSAYPHSSPLIETAIRWRVHLFFLEDEKQKINQYFDTHHCFPPYFHHSIQELVMIVYPEGAPDRTFFDQVQSFLMPEGAKIQTEISTLEYSLSEREAALRMEQTPLLIHRFANDLWRQFQQGHLSKNSLDYAVETLRKFQTKNGAFPSVDRIDQMLIQLIFSTGSSMEPNPFPRLKAEQIHQPEHCSSRWEILHYAEQLYCAEPTPRPSAPPEDFPLPSAPPFDPLIENQIKNVVLPSLHPDHHPSLQPVQEVHQTALIAPTVDPLYAPVSYLDLHYRIHFAGKDAQAIWGLLLNVQKRDVLRHIVRGNAIGIAEMAAMTLFPPSKRHLLSRFFKEPIAKMLESYRKEPPKDYPWMADAEFLEQAEKVLELFYKNDQDYYAEFMKLPPNSHFFLLVYLQAQEAKIPIPADIPNWAELHWNSPHMLEHSILALERFIHCLPIT